MLRQILLLLMVAFTTAFAPGSLPTRASVTHTTFVGDRSTHVTRANFDKTVLAAGAVVERVKEKVAAPVRKKATTGNGAWEVRIYNDGLNTREHVARCLVQVTGLSEIAAYQTMMQAHQNGIAVVGRWYYEQAEMYFEALKKNGIVCDLIPVDEDKGS